MYEGLIEDWKLSKVPFCDLGRLENYQNIFPKETRASVGKKGGQIKALWKSP